MELKVIAGDLTWKGRKSELESIKQVWMLRGKQSNNSRKPHDSWVNYLPVCLDKLPKLGL